MVVFRESPTSKKPSQKSTWIKAKHDGESQMILDAGQKEYGTRQCPECSMVYHLKDPEDELLHQKIHDSLKDSLRFLVSEISGDYQFATDYVGLLFLGVEEGEGSSTLRCR